MQADDTVLSQQKLTAEERRCPQCGILVPEELERCPADGTVLSPTVDVELSGRYELIEPIGKGGMSVVYKARHRLMGNLVAVKLLQDKLTDNPTHQKRFQQEAQAAAMLDHTSLIKVHDFGILPSGFTFLVMDYADGHSLGELITKTGQLQASRALPLFIQICDGLSHAHAKGILHRDLKPSNVIVVEDPQGERAKIVDFGIAKLQGVQEYDAKLTATGEVFGSPYYMSPEQCTGGAVDGRSDIYAMGVLMYETVSGKVPLSGSNVFETIHKQISDVPIPLAKVVSNPLAKDMSPIVEKALQKDPADRYQSFDEMLADLKALAEGRRVKVKTRLPAGKALAAAIASATLFLGATLAACYFTQSGPFSPQVVHELPKSAAGAAPPTVAAKVDPLDEDTEGDDAEEAPLNRKEKPEKTLNEGLWLMGMTDQAELQQWRDYPLRNVINLIGRQVGAKQIETLAENKNAYKLNLQGNATIDDTALLPLRGHPNLETLRLTGSSITAKSIDDVFTTLPKLSHLMIGNTKIGADDIPKLAKIPTLRDVWLMEMNLKDSDFENFPVFPTVTKLRLDDNAELTDACIPLIARKFPNLSTLAFRRIPITDKSFPALIAMPKLRHLRINGSRMTVTGVNSVPFNRNMEIAWDGGDEAGTRYAEGKQNAWRHAGRWHPAISGQAVTLAGKLASDDELLAVAKEVRVQQIWIEKAPNITDNAFAGFRSRRVVKLSRTHVNLDEPFFQILPQMTGLQFLQLTGSKFDPQNLKYLESCGFLTALRVDGNALSRKEDLQYLPRQLDSINISSNPWFDSSCVTILRERLPNLSWWHMSHTAIDDAAIDDFFKAKRISTLIVSKERFTPAGLKRLEKLEARGVKVTFE